MVLNLVPLQYGSVLIGTIMFYFITGIFYRNTLLSLSVLKFEI
jgi:hypothetical protein